MLRWNKLGIVFNPSQVLHRPEWMFEFAQAPNTLVYDDFVRVFFSCRGKADDRGQTISYCAYVDLSRNNLKNIVRISDHPLIPLGGIGHFDEFGTYVFTPVRHGDKIYAYYAGVTRCESVPTNTAIGLVISSDSGNVFEKFGHGPILSYSPDEPFIISSPKIRKFNDVFYLYYISGKEWVVDENRVEPIYRIRMAKSHDGINWVKHNKDLIPENKHKEAQASPDVIYMNGMYHMFFCHRDAIDYRKNRNNSYRIGYAKSSDLIDWHRNDSIAGIDVSSSLEDFDGEMVAYPHVFALDGKIYMLYIGNEFGRHGFALAELVGSLS